MRTPAESSGATKQQPRRRDRPTSALDDLRRRRSRARRDRAARAPDAGGQSRRRAGSSTKRASARPATVALSHDTTMRAGGTPRTDSETSRGDASALERDERSRRGGERLGRRPDERACAGCAAPARRVRPARGASRPAQTRIARGATRMQPLEQQQPLRRCSSASRPGAIGDHDDGRACRHRHIGRSRELCGEAFDRRRLDDVERLAFGDAPGLVDQPNAVAPRSGARARGPARRPARPRRRWRHHACVRYCNGCQPGASACRLRAIKHMESLKGKVAIVTGGSRGIGLAIARALVAEGVQVAVTGRDERHLSAARPKIEAAGPGLRRDAAGGCPHCRGRRACRRRRRSRASAASIFS